jgi:hypothetical protein
MRRREGGDAYVDAGVPPAELVEYVAWCAGRDVRHKWVIRLVGGT